MKLFRASKLSHWASEPRQTSYRKCKLNKSVPRKWQPAFYLRGKCTKAHTHIGKMSINNEKIKANGKAGAHTRSSLDSQTKLMKARCYNMRVCFRKISAGFYVFQKKNEYIIVYWWIRMRLWAYFNNLFIACIRERIMRIFKNANVYIVYLILPINKI